MTLPQVAQHSSFESVTPMVWRRQPGANGLIGKFIDGQHQNVSSLVISSPWAGCDLGSVGGQAGGLQSPK